MTDVADQQQKQPIDGGTFIRQLIERAFYALPPRYNKREFVLAVRDEARAFPEEWAKFMESAEVQAVSAVVSTLEVRTRRSRSGLFDRNKAARDRVESIGAGRPAMARYATRSGIYSEIMTMTLAEMERKAIDAQVGAAARNREAWRWRTLAALHRMRAEQLGIPLDGDTTNEQVLTVEEVEAVLAEAEEH
jgi:hypothetical protein